MATLNFCADTGAVPYLVVPDEETAQSLYRHLAANGLVPTRPYTISDELRIDLPALMPQTEPVIESWFADCRLTTHKMTDGTTIKWDFDARPHQSTYPHVRRIDPH